MATQALDKPHHARKRRSMLVWLMAQYSRRRYGAVLTPIQELYSKAPWLAGFALKIWRRSNRLSLSELEVQQVFRRVAQLDECAFCEDLHRAEEQRLQGVEEADALAQWRSWESLSARSSAMLDYVEQCVLMGHPEPECAATAEHVLGSQTRLELTWLIAVAKYYSVLGRAYGFESQGLSA